MHIIAHAFEVTVAAAVHNQRLVSPTEEMTENLVPPIVPTGVNAQQPFHPFHQVAIRCFEDQVKVVRHQTEAVNLPGGLLASLRQRRQEQLAVVIVGEDCLLVVPAVHHVVDRPRVLDAQLPSHKLWVQISSAQVSCQQGNITLSLTDTFWERQQAIKSKVREVLRF